MSFLYEQAKAPRALSVEEQRSLDFQANLLKAMTRAPVPDAIGVALSYLLWCIYNEPGVVRRCLNEPVIKQGFRGEKLIAELNRAAR